MLTSKHFGKASDLTPLLAVGPPDRRHQQRFRCPYCPVQRGSADTQGKFYYDIKRKVGLCFRCGTVIAEDTTNYDLGEQAIAMLAAINKIDVGVDEQTPQIYTLNDWTCPVEQVPEVASYLASRNITESVINRFFIRACTVPFPGVVLPDRIFEYRGQVCTDFFQIRNINPYAKMKYRSPSEARKPVYGASLYVPGVDVGIICEGVFSAIAAVRTRPTFLPLCTYGKSIKIEQLREVEQLPLTKLAVCYDGGEFRAMMDAVSQLLSSGKEVFAVLLPDGHDPNSINDMQLEFSLQTMYPMSYLTCAMWGHLYRNEARGDWTRLRQLALGE